MFLLFFNLKIGKLGFSHNQGIMVKVQLSNKMSFTVKSETLPSTV